MKSMRNIAITIVVVIVGAWLALKFFTVDIPAGKVGVRTQEYAVFGKRGLVQKDFGPGYHRDLGPVDSWELFDSTVQTLELTRDPFYGNRRGRDDVQVRSADGNEVSVDVTVKYRIEPGKAHKLYADTGAGDKYKRVVRTQAQDTFMDVFGQMNTEEFYSPSVRREKATIARQRLTNQLEDRFVEVVDVLIRNVEFDAEYEKRIRRKKLADQEVQLNQSMEKAAQKRGETQKVEAETAKAIKIIQQQRKAEIRVMRAETDLQIARIKAAANKDAAQKRADADLIAAQKNAEGTLLVGNAKAQGERRRNEALAVPGGSTLVALEAARNLSFSDFVISTLNIDVLDLDAMARKLGGEEED